MSTGILFQQEMVAAILRGQKLQTRRICKPKGFDVTNMQYCSKVKYEQKLLGTQFYFSDHKACEGDQLGTKCQYGEAGNLLYVKETFYAYGWWIKNGDKWRFIDFTPEDRDGRYGYFDDIPSDVTNTRVEKKMGWYKRPALFMPRHASRITLEVTDVNIDRLQLIGQQAAIEEGIEIHKSTQKHLLDGWKDYQGKYDYYANPINSYKSLWNKINGDGSWDMNPWVWIINFKRV